MEPQIILIALTVLGAITVAVLGWIDSGEPFNPRKFGASIAFLIGAGIDVAGHRLAGTLDQARSTT